MAECVFKGGTVATSEGVAQVDVTVSGDVIIAIGNNLKAEQYIDISGKILCPGGVDPHCHVEQMSGMGLMNADDWSSATRSAALGGTTSLISHMPQATGQRLSAAMADYAVRAERAAGALICVHAENEGMIGYMKAALTRAGLTAARYHAFSHPRLAEIEAIERMCRFAEFLDQPLMVFHVSTREGVEAVRAAQARGIPVVAETCTHYLFQTVDVLDKPGVEGAKWMCSPPQRLVDDQDALWEGLAEGTPSFLQQLCIVSFWDAGLEVVLYHHGDVQNVPKGRTCCTRIRAPQRCIRTSSATGFWSRKTGSSGRIRMPMA